MSKLTDFRIIDADHVRLDRLEDIATAQAQRIEQLEEELHDLSLAIEEMQQPKQKDVAEMERIAHLEDRLNRLNQLVGMVANPATTQKSPVSTPKKKGMSYSPLDPFMKRHRKIRVTKRFK